MKKLVLATVFSTMVVMMCSSCTLLALFGLGKQVKDELDDIAANIVTVNVTLKGDKVIDAASATLHYEITAEKALSDVKVCYSSYFDYDKADSQYILLNGESLGTSKSGDYTAKKNGYYYFAAKNTSTGTDYEYYCVDWLAE